MGGASRLLRRHLRRRFRFYSPLFSHIHTPNTTPLPPPLVFSTRHYWRCSSRPPPHPSTPAALPFRSFSWNASTGDSGVEKDLSMSEGDSVSGLELLDLGLDGLKGVAEEVGGEGLWYVPVRGLISLLDGYHDISGLPWWTVIATSTLVLRVSLIPVLIMQLRKLGNLSELFPKLPPPLPPPFSGITFREQFLLHRKKRRELGCPSYLWSFAFFTVQFPCFLLWMTSIRRMSLDGHPGFNNGGALWFQDLTVFPHGVCGPIFPLLVAGLHFVNVQVSFKTLKLASMPGLLGLLARYYKLYLNILSIPLLVIGFYVPQGSLVYWATNSSLTLIQQLLLKNTHIREKLGLPDIDDKKKSRNFTEMNLLMKNHVSTKSLLHGKSASLEQQLSTKIENLSPEELLELGLQHYASGNRDVALSLIRPATEKDPNLVRALIAMGQIQCSRGSLEEAAEYFERAISKIQEDEELGLLVLASFGAGISYKLQGRKPEAIKHWKRISRLKEPEAPMDKACYYKGLVILASTLFEEGEKTEAAEYLRRATAYDPNVGILLKECEESLEGNK